GRRQLPAPANWDRAQASWRQTADPQIATMLKQVGVIFGDGVAMKELLKTARDKDMPAATRRSALQSMVSVKAPGTAALLQSLINDRAVQSVAIGGLAAFDDPSTAEILLKRYPRMDRPQKEEIVEVLTTRPSYALKLLAAVEKNQVRREDISAQQAQQLNNLGSAQVREDLERVWGSIQVSSAEQQRQLLAVKQMLQAAESKPADLAAGRALFKKRCANCHRLFGDGENIGPDLTGSGRANLDYILQNTVTPSAVVAAGYRVSIVATKDGRVLTGIVNEVSPQLITVQTAKERVRLQKADVEQVKGLAASLMPDNLLKELNDQQVLNLIRYLASPRQVALSPVGSESSK
ncbi:MAG TPA: c-type cytochrome, partial [Planctomycetes bacterium]|nr:c-type cytochrome [Planctomycetota bacterium]